MTDTRIVEQGNLPTVYLIVFEDEVCEERLRAVPRVFNTYNEAVSRQLEIGKSNPATSWIVRCPDPRQVSND